MENQTNIIMDEAAEKQRFRRHTEWLHWGTLSYEAVIVTVSVIVTLFYMIVEGVAMYIKTQNFDMDEVADKVLKTDGGMLIAVLIGSIFMGFFMMKKVKVKEIFAKKAKITFPTFIALLFVFMLIQFPADLMISLFETLLNQVGLTAEQAIESASGGSKSFTMFLYLGFGAPIFEEIIFRGFAMNAYYKANGSKTFAIFMSAVLFGVMHGNPVQIFYAFVVGLVLGYTAMEYSIIWSILLHILNNFVFSDMLGKISSRLPEPAQNIVDWGVLIVFFIGGVILLIVNRKTAIAYLKENLCDKKYFKWAVLSVPLLLFFIANTVMALLSIGKIE